MGISYKKGAPTIRLVKWTILQILAYIAQLPKLNVPIQNRVYTIHCHCTPHYVVSLLAILDITFLVESVVEQIGIDKNHVFICCCWHILNTY